MAQHDYSIANQGFPAFRSDLNNALAAIVSNNSGATQPTTMFAHQMWVDTSANPSILKIRNADNDAWITIGSIDQTGDTFTLTSAVSATTLNTSGAVVFNDAGADVDFRVEGDSYTHLLFVDASTDRVGIGPSDPLTPLDVQGASTLNTDVEYAGFRGGSTSQPYLRIGGNNTTNFAIRYAFLNSEDASGSGQALAFQTGGTERMRITSGGYLKASNNGTYVSQTGTYHEFSNNDDGNTIVNFKHNGTSGNQYGLAIVTANDQNDTTRYFLTCIGGATTRLTIRSNGGIANYSANNVNLSDARVKKDIENLGSQWNCLKEWNLVEFRYNEQADDAPKNYGVIAQQIQEHCPEVVQVFQEAKDAVEAKEAVLDEDGNVVEPAVEAQPAQEERIGVREQQMLWMAVKALQEAMERIETLEAKVAALENA